LIFIDIFSSLDLVFSFVDIEIHVYQFALNFIQNILIVCAFVHFQLLDQFFISIYLLVCILQLST